MFFFKKKNLHVCKGMCLKIHAYSCNHCISCKQLNPNPYRLCTLAVTRSNQIRYSTLYTSTYTVCNIFGTYFKRGFVRVGFTERQMELEGVHHWLWLNRRIVEAFAQDCPVWTDVVTAIFCIVSLIWII